MRKKWIVASSLSLILLAGLVVLLRFPLNQLRTLASLRTVDDHPLYVMTYYGRYPGPGVPAGSRPAASRPAGGTEWACTCFAALGQAGDMSFGRNFDWYDHPALLLFTDPPDGYASVSMVDISYLGYGRELPSWRDRLNLLSAPLLPFDGLNERGLAVGMMAVPHAEGGRDPRKATLDGLEVIRLLLDRVQDVDQAIALLQDYNVDFGGGPPVHYLVADASGHAAVIEYIAGEVRALRNTERWQVATNFVIAEAMPQGAQSGCWRYNAAYEALQRTGGIMSTQEAMPLLQEVSQENTIWSTVYNMTSGQIRVAMGRKYDRVHTFRLKMDDR